MVVAVAVAVAIAVAVGGGRGGGKDLPGKAVYPVTWLDKFANFSGEAKQTGNKLR